METYTLTNDFHNTATRVRANGRRNAFGETVIQLTSSQKHRAEKALCGLAGCTCGGVRGIQHAKNGDRLIIDA